MNEYSIWSPFQADMKVRTVLDFLIRLRLLSVRVGEQQGVKLTLLDPLCLLWMLISTRNMESFSINK